MRHSIRRLLGSVPAPTAAVQRRTLSLSSHLRSRNQIQVERQFTANRPSISQSIQWRQALSTSIPRTYSTEASKPPSSPEEPPKEPEEPEKESPIKDRFQLIPFSVALVLCACWSYFSEDGYLAKLAQDSGKASKKSRGKAAGALNTENFVPFTVVAREEVSPTAFVLTLRLPESVSDEARSTTAEAIREAWQHGLWSVEVKQPQLQIARDYTPLPRVGEGQREDDIRLFVRVVPGGEVSKYLSKKTVGATVDLRGPRLSFDVAARMGKSGVEGQETRGDGKDVKQVVVLAGGTGISTALQAADVALRRGSTVSILWANRQPDDSIGLFGDVDVSTANPVVRDIRALQSRYGADRLRVSSFVDAQQTIITDKEVRKAIEGQDTTESDRSWYYPFGSGKASQKMEKIPAAVTTNPSCVYHSARVLERLEADELKGSDTAKACSCSTTGSPDSVGKNLVLVSGPDGFIAAWAGPKSWSGGKERQGPVSGILGHLAARDPQTFAGWQVLKL